MKNQIFILLLLFAGILSGQSNSSEAKKDDKAENRSPKYVKKCRKIKTQEIIYNFLEGQFEKSIIKPCQKIPTTLKVTNINNYFYDVQIQAKDININSEDFNENKLEITKQAIIRIDTTAVLGILDTKSINILPIQTQKENIIETNIARRKIKEYEDILQQKKSDLNLLETDIKKLTIDVNLFEGKKNIEDEIKELDKLPDSLKIKNSLYELKIFELKSLNEKYKNFDVNKIKNEIEEKKITRDLKINEISIESANLEQEVINLKDKTVIREMVNEGIQKLNKKYYELDTEFVEVLKIAGAYNNYLYKIYRPNIVREEYLKLKFSQEPFGTMSIIKLEKFSEYEETLKRFSKIHSGFQNLFYDIVNRNNFLLAGNNDDLLILKSTLQIEYNRLKSVTDQMLAKVDNMNLSIKLNAVEIYNRELQNDKTFEYVSDPIQGLGDYIEFDVVIKPKVAFNEVFAKNQSRRFKYSEYLRGGLRYDFSVGTVFDFVNKDQNFENRNNILTRNSNNQYQPTLAGFFHASFRSNSLASVGMTLGASLNITEFDINSLFVGPSLLLGKKEKFILTSGLSLRKTKQLKNGYAEGQTIVAQSNIDDYLTSNFRLGFFVGVSYNLTKKQKTSVKIANNSD